MFQVEWAQKQAWQSEQNSFPPFVSKLRREDVRRAHFLHWEEHCLECAVPLCYKTCPMYIARPDKACARFRYGIYPNPNFQGLFDFGADIRFRRWGKLETLVHGRTGTVEFQRSVDWLNRIATPAPNGSTGNSAKVFWKKNFAKARGKFFLWSRPAPEDDAYDAFVLECFSPDPEPFRLVLEYFAGNMTKDHTFVGKLKARHSFDICPGWNFETLPGKPFIFGPNNRAGKISIYPENNGERRLIFTWLDLVKYRSERVPEASAPAPRAPAAKVKCVAWDLDNTLWQGILAETTGSRLEPRPGVVEVIRKLDERGIIQTAVSKNNFEDAWPTLGELGLQDYFLHPEINWNPKSQNLIRIAEKLNINLDTFALVDDSAFERAEVQTALPQVRVYSEDQIEALLNYAEFNVPVSESSKQRRFSYLTEIKRENEKQAFSDYEAFLRSCNMKLRLFFPREEQHILRCLELIQRANQLNLSGNRYTNEEFRDLLSRPGMLCVAMECSDRFGNYGIIGFASVDESPQTPAINNLVLSCRVAQKRVEHTFIQWLAVRESKRDRQALRAELIRTDRNQPLLKVFDDLAFHAQAQMGQRCVMELPLASHARIEAPMTIETAAELDTSTLALPSLVADPQ